MDRVLWGWLLTLESPSLFPLSQKLLPTFLVLQLQAACECAPLPPGGLIWEGEQSLPVRLYPGPWGKTQLPGPGRRWRTQGATSEAVGAETLPPPLPPALWGLNCHCGASPLSLRVSCPSVLPEPWAGLWLGAAHREEMDWGDAPVASGAGGAKFDPWGHGPRGWVCLELCTKRG